MAYTLANIRFEARDSVLHAGPDSYSDAKIDAGFKYAAERVLLETGMGRKIGSFTTTAGNAEATLAIDGLLPAERWAPPYREADDFPMQVVALDTIYRHRDRSSASGEPEFISCVSPTKALLYPTPDAAYTIRLPYTAGLTPFTTGTQGAYSASVTYGRGDVVSSGGNAYRCVADGTSGVVPAPSEPWTLLGTVSDVPVEAPSALTFLDIPDRIMPDLLKFGAMGYVWFGAPGHVDAGPAMAEFMRCIERWKGSVQESGVWHAGPQRYSGTGTYTHAGGI
ncbi:MAG: hypothetical protein AAGH92_08635 [Planctomycetota bacterium]